MHGVNDIQDFLYGEVAMCSDIISVILYTDGRGWSYSLSGLDCKGN